VTNIADHLKKGRRSSPTAMASGSRISTGAGSSISALACGASNVGYGRPEIAEAAAKAIKDLSYYHLFGSASNEPIIRLADRVLGLFREKADAGHLSKIFFGTSARTPTTPISSWCATTTTCSAGRRRRRSSRGSAPITA